MFVEFDTAQDLLKKYGSPLYVYSESILRQRCRDLLEAFRGRIKPSFSAKSNTNLSLLKIIREEGLGADAMSPGEIFVLQNAGFAPEEIFYIGNNVSCEEMSYCIERGILVSVDSLSQLEQFGQIDPGGSVAVRFNPGMGAGHCEKVITAGHKTKFGIQSEFYPEVKEIIEKYDVDKNEIFDELIAFLIKRNELNKVIIDKMLKSTWNMIKSWFHNLDEQAELEDLNSQIEKLGNDTLNIHSIVENYENSKLSSVGSRNYQHNQDKKVRVEQAAIQTCCAYFEKLGYKVKSVEKDNVGWDLVAETDKVSLRIEVKGLSGSAFSIELTPNEYKAFKEEAEDYRLAVVINALENPVLSICRYSKELNKWLVETNGEKDRFLNIKPKDSATISCL